MKETLSRAGIALYSKVCMCAKSLQLCPALWDLWTIACQASLSMGFSRQEYWSGLLFPFAGDLPNPGTELVSPASPELAVWFFTTSASWGGLYI